MVSDCCRILSSNGIWIPVYNFASILKTKSDHIFLISFMDYPHYEVRYVYCRGIEYPLVESRSVPAVVKWQLPLCNQVYITLADIFTIFSFNATA